jgi:hypothetical protein
VRPFADLLTSPADLKRVTVTILGVIDRSFATHKCRVTQDEVKRRFAICERWFRDLRSTHGWSVERCLSNLDDALQAELDGATFVPNTRALWTPNRDLAVGPGLIADLRGK